MSTTTIRLSDQLKARVAKAAQRSGKTPHNFIVEAIAERTAEDERRAEFHEVAERRYEQIAADGLTIPWERMRAFLKQRVAGKPVRRPRARKLGRG